MQKKTAEEIVPFSSAVSGGVFLIGDSVVARCA